MDDEEKKMKLHAVAPGRPPEGHHARVVVKKGVRLKLHAVPPGVSVQKGAGDGL
jgi:hypothetical protein